MLSRIGKEKKNTESKKVHRRVCTEADELYPLKVNKPELKRNNEKTSSKPKFIDVCSKYMAKDVHVNRELHPRDYRVIRDKDRQRDSEVKEGSQIREMRNVKVVKQQKETQEQPTKRNFKISQTRANIDKYMRTEPDEAVRHSGPLQMRRQGRYEIEGVAGKGTFGVVYFGQDRKTGERIAIKKVLQDKKYKNRQLQILKMLQHPNNLSIRDSFLSNEGQEQYLNIVMEYYPDNLYQLIKRKQLNQDLIKLYSYQIFRGLNYLAMLGIAHRDIKPQNILVDSATCRLIISDFGSAKQLTPTQPNLAYICSRCYRAPELIFGATNYCTQIDMWSTGCVIVEMANGSPSFMGDSQVDQMIEIIKILGTPTRFDVQEMNPAYDMKEYSKFPKIRTSSWKNLLHYKDPLLVDLITRILQYSPLHRITPAQALKHEYFAQLRDEASFKEITCRFKSVPNLFDYSPQELAFANQTSEPGTKLVPPWVESHKESDSKITTSIPSTKRSFAKYKLI